MRESAPRIAVIGPGALGTLFAARLARAGLPVLLLDHRPARAAKLAAQGLCLREDRGEGRVHLPVTADPRRLAAVEAAVILVKAYQTEEVALTLAAHLPEAAYALTLQNGLGNVEILQAHLGAARAYGGTTAQGALLEEPGVVRDTGSGPTVLGRSDGAPDARLEALAARLVAAGFPTVCTADLPAALWMKAILNAALNPVAALARLRNGELAAHEESLALMTAAAREAAVIARTHGIGIAEEDWRARLRTICAATAPNINSMLQDVLRGRRTEIDAITGAIVRTGEQHSLPAPVNRTLWYLLKMVEASHERRVSA